MFIELFRPWTWRMALRDSRKQRKKLLLFSVSIMFGIAGLVAIGSLKDNLLDAIETQAKALVGSDVFINGRKTFTPELETLFEKSGGTVLREEASWGNLEIRSGTPQALFLRVEARGVEPGFPYYGLIITDPPDAWQRCLAGEGIVAGPAVLEQLSALPGDSVKLGAHDTKILGALLRAPAPASWAGAMGVIAPEVYVARQHFKATAMGSSLFGFHRAHMKFSKDAVAEEWAKKNRDPFKKAGFDMETSEKRRKNASEVLQHLYSFLSLLAFIALVLGGLGIASAIHVHAQNRLPSVATLRCLGCTNSQAFAIYLVQGFCLGLTGATGGVLLGLGLQKFMPWLFRDYIPIEVTLTVHPTSVLMALALGFLICMSFALLPLLKMRKISPLAAVRASVAELPPPWSWKNWLLLVAWGALGWTWFYYGNSNGETAWRIGMVVLCWMGAGILVRATDPFWWLITGTLVTALTLLAWEVSPPKKPEVGFGFVMALSFALLIITAMGKLLTWLVRLVLRPAWPYALRQGFSNLHRPRNQTLLFLLSAGLGTGMILNMVLTQKLILTSLESKTLKDKPNLLFIDVKKEQAADIRQAMENAQATEIQHLPMVMMNMTHLNGESLEALYKDPKNKVDRWLGRHDFRSTFRDELASSEKLIQGEMPGKWDGKFPVKITVEKGLAERNELKVGGKLTFKVNNQPMECVISGIREVQWSDLGLNFFFVFPNGVFDNFPQTGVVTAKIAPEKTLAVQREVARKHPGLNAFDLGEIFSTINEIVDKVAFVIRFMALFTILTGVVILVAVLLVGKNDRMLESVLLRTLGADRRKIWQVLVSEYALLGFLSSATGAILAVGGTTLLAKYVFKLPEHTWHLPGVIAVATVTAFTVVVGLLLSRGIASAPPLQILRGENG